MFMIKGSSGIRVKFGLGFKVVNQGLVQHEYTTKW
jgi:hypothetical protein